MHLVCACSAGYPLLYVSQTQGMCRMQDRFPAIPPVAEKKPEEVQQGSWILT